MFTGFFVFWKHQIIHFLDQCQKLWSIGPSGTGAKLAMGDM